MVGSVVAAWWFITRPAPREAPPVPAERLETGFLTVSAAAIDLELIAPDGRRAHTAHVADTTNAIPGARGAVDCGGYGRALESNAVCSASIMVQEPALGSWRVVAHATDSARYVALTVGYGGRTFRKTGGFTVRLNVQPRRPVTFDVTAQVEGVTQRTQPRVDAPPPP